MLKITSHFIQTGQCKDKESKPQRASNAVSYRANEDGPLAPFERSHKGKQLFSQYRAGINKLRDFLNASGTNDAEAAAGRFAEFANRVEQGSRGFFSTEIALLYGQGKEALDSLCDDIENESIPLHVRASHVDNLSSDLLVCASGTVSNLIIAAQDLKLSTGGLWNSAKSAWESLLDQAIREFVELRHGRDENYRGNEIHYVNGYRNFLADDYGVDVRVDNFVPPTLGNLQALGRCRAFIEQRVNATQLVRCLAERCLSDVHERFGSYRNRPLGAVEAWAFYQEYSKTLDASLQSRYGKIDPDVFVNSYEGRGTEEAPYAMIENPTTLMREIARNLRQPLVLEKIKLPIAHGAKESEQAIKQIGDDAFYVKTRRAEGRGYKALVVSDLPAHDAPPVMVKAALINTREPGMLRQLPPAFVWRMLEAEPELVTWLNTFSHPAVVRFRRADSAHDAFLLDRAAQRIRGYSQEDRRLVFKIGLRQNEDDLTARVVASIGDIDELDREQNTALHAAARFGCAKTVAAIACRTERLSHFNAFGHTPLMLAASKGHTDAMRELLNKGAPPDARNARGENALHSAALSGNAAAAALLLASDADADACDDAGENAMTRAARFGHVEVVELLARPGAKLDAMNGSNWTALMCAAGEGHAAVVRTLLEAGAPVGQRGGMTGITALMLAAEHGRLSALHVLHELAADLEQRDDNGCTALVRAAHRGQGESVNTLIAMGSSVAARNNGGATALIAAGRNGHAACAAALLRAGADVNESRLDGSTALMEAARGGHLEMVNLLLRQRRRVNIDRPDNEGRTALIWAATHGRTACAVALSNAGAHLDAQLPDGTTALMAAVKNGHNTTVHALLLARANPYTADRHGASALGHAALEGNVEATSLLLAARVPPDIRDTGGHTPMMYAASRGHVNVIAVLLRARANINQRSYEGWSELMMAAQYGHADAAVALLRAGAAPLAVNNIGATASMLAYHFGHLDVVEAIRRWQPRR